MISSLHSAQCHSVTAAGSFYKQTFPRLLISRPLITWLSWLSVDVSVGIAQIPLRQNVPAQVMSCTIESPQLRSNIFTVPVIEDFPARGRFECLWRYLLSSFPLQAGLWNKRSAMIIEQPHMPTHTPLLVQHKQKGAPRRHLHLHSCHGKLLRDISWLESDFRQSKKHNRAKH